MNCSAAYKRGSNANTPFEGCLPASTLLFDLDGTLADTAPDLTRALNRVLDALSYPEVTLEDTRNWIGNGIRRLLECAFARGGQNEPNSEVVEQGVALLELFYAGSVWIDSTCYPGVVDGLTELKRLGFKIGCVTNKPRSSTCTLLQQSGLNSFFEMVVAGDDLLETKPRPGPLLYAANKLGVAPKDCVMIGDSKNDVDSARAAGMPVLVVMWGYHQGLDLSTIGATRLVSQFNQIFQIVTLSA